MALQEYECVDKVPEGLELQPPASLVPAKWTLCVDINEIGHFDYKDVYCWVLAKESWEASFWCEGVDVWSNVNLRNVCKPGIHFAMQHPSSSLVTHTHHDDLSLTLFLPTCTDMPSWKTNGDSLASTTWTKRRQGIPSYVSSHTSLVLVWGPWAFLFGKVSAWETDSIHVWSRGRWMKHHVLE